MLPQAFKEESKKTIALKQLRQLEHKARLYPKYQSALELAKQKTIKEAIKRKKSKEQLSLL